MRTLRTMVIIPLALIAALASPALGQDRHTLSPSALAATVADEVARQDAERAAVRTALDRPEVRDVAQRSGIDLDRVRAAIDTLPPAALSQAAAAATQVNETLVGGASTVVISTTTIIIALLLVLLIVIAVD